MSRRVVLAYSGGPASAVAIPWLREQRDAEVVTVTVDLGQSEPLDGIRVRAIGSGAARAHVLDRRDVFARHHLMPAVHDGAVDIDSPAAMAALARPLIAHALVEIAEIEGAPAVAHATPDPVKRASLDASLRAMAPDLAIIDVVLPWPLGSEAMADYARERGIPLLAPADAVAPRVTAAAPVVIRLDFKNGVPQKINGVEMDLVELMTSLDTIASAQGAAGGAVLGAAFRALQERTGSANASGAATVRVANGACEVIDHVR